MHQIISLQNVRASWDTYRMALLDFKTCPGDVFDAGLAKYPNSATDG